MTASPGQIYEHDILGKRTWRNPFSSATVDGTTLTQTGTTYALGARGIDMLHPYSVDTSNATRTYGDPQFPLYDGHGNMAATLSRSSSSPYYAIANERTYDVWGGVRSGASTGDPNTRYCANLGHKQDDESGLIYMRARYYEPGTGRFVSEDPERDGKNWVVYGGDNPISNIDPQGTLSTLTAALLFYCIAAICLGLTISFRYFVHQDGVTGLVEYLKEMRERGLDADELGDAVTLEAYNNARTASPNMKRMLRSGWGAAGTALMGHICLIKYLLYDVSLVEQGIYLDPSGGD